MLLRRLVVCAILAGSAFALHADEGMWQPGQMPQIADTLRERGLALDPAELTDLTGPTLGAVVSLGFCTGSFVSPNGLLVTNHHCAYGTIQYNSTAERNLIQSGFVAPTPADDLPGDPNLRVYVTEDIRDVTRDVNAGIAPTLGGYERYRAIDRAEKALVRKCEKDGIHCDVYVFHGGLSYQLVRQREIRDVRLAYAPPASIGKFGGDVDNWMWPRHTGDFAFLRAYVGPDGKSATYAKENVPFTPRHWLDINPDGVAAGDFVMLAGYPGRTNRYRLAEEVKDAIEWNYPAQSAIVDELLDTIADTTAQAPAAAVKYASIVASFNNARKNYDGQLAGLAKADAVAVKLERERALQAALAADGAASTTFDADLAALRAVLAEQRATRERDLVMQYLARTGLYAASYTIYRNAIERAKPDSEREYGFQQRDALKLEGTLKLLERRMDPAVDQALMRKLLRRHAALPAAQHVAAIDAWLGGGAVDAAQIDAKVAALYAGTKLTDTAERVRLFTQPRHALDASDDTALKWMSALMPDLLAIERAKQGRLGDEMKLRPRFMQAMIDYNRGQQRSIYPDANGSLRISFGRVQGYARDGVVYSAFTTAAGIAEKATGIAPFDAPARLLEAIAANDYGDTRLPAPGSLPVNFQADLDITGGNSGSPVLDAHGRLVGLAFDGTWDSVSGDWIFEPALTRAIGVDIRYLLWVMNRIDGAGHLVREMNATPAPASRSNASR